METRTVQERVIEVFACESCNRCEDITPELQLDDSVMNIEWDDPMVRIVYISGLEEEFGIEYIADDAIDRWQTIADIIVYFESVAHS